MDRALRLLVHIGAVLVPQENELFCDGQSLECFLVLVLVVVFVADYDHRDVHSAAFVSVDLLRSQVQTGVHKFALFFLAALVARLQLVESAVCKCEAHHLLQQFVLHVLRNHVLHLELLLGYFGFEEDVVETLHLILFLTIQIR